MSEPTVPAGGAAAADETPLQPRSAGAILKTALRLWLANFPLLFAIAVVPQLPALALVGTGAASLSSGPLTIGVLAGWLGYVVSTGALITPSLYLTVGRSARFGDSFTMFWPSFGWYLLTTTLVSVAMIAIFLICLIGFLSIHGFIGILTGVLTVVVVAVLLAYAGLAVVIERISTRSALARTFTLVRGNFLRTLFTLATVFVPSMICVVLVVSVLEVVMRFSPALPFFAGIVQGVLIEAFAPLMTLTLVGLYIDQRGRQDEITVEALLWRFQVAGNPGIPQALR